MTPGQLARSGQEAKCAMAHGALDLNQGTGTRLFQLFLRSIIDACIDFHLPLHAGCHDLPRS